jgi:N-methylhydantoinase B
VVIVPVDPELDKYEIDSSATAEKRDWIRANRANWLAEDPQTVADRFRAGELGLLDVIRRYGVILDWGTGELFAETTRQHRAQMIRRSAAHWDA